MKNIIFLLFFVIFSIASCEKPVSSSKDTDQAAMPDTAVDTDVGQDDDSFIPPDTDFPQKDADPMIEDGDISDTDIPHPSDTDDPTGDEDTGITDSDDIIVIDSDSITADEDLLIPDSDAAVFSDKKIVGYFIEWGIYARNYHVMDIPADKITHVNYAFAQITNGEVALYDTFAAIEKSYPGDVWDQPVKGSFNQLVKLKTAYPHMKTLISVGGWTLSSSFSDVALTDGSRKKFSASAVSFIRAYQFDGVDIDWEYPVSGGLDGNITRPEDKHNFSLLMAQLRSDLDTASIQDGKKYLLTASVAAGADKIANLEVSALSESVDWLNIMTYDFQGAWNTEHTGHQSGLFGNPLDPSLADGYYGKHAVDTYLAGGAPPEKLIYGVPFYGRAWQGVNATNNGLFQKPGPGIPPGTWDDYQSGNTGVNDYKQIIDFSHSGTMYTRSFDQSADVPWLYSAVQYSGHFITYDDTESVSIKADYVIDNKLAGMMVWELSADKPVDSPDSLITLIYDKLRPEHPDPDPLPDSDTFVSPDDDISFPDNDIAVPDPDTSLPDTDVPDFTDPVAVGYWENWNRDGAFFPLSECDIRYNVINVAFLTTQTDGSVVLYIEPGTQPLSQQEITALKAKGTKVLISVGGQNGYFYVDSQAKADKFVETLIPIIDNYGFDGLDIDLEHGLTAGGTPDNPTGTVVYLISILQALKTHYGPHFLLTFAPETANLSPEAYGGIWSSYLPVLMALGDDVDWVHMQYYNSGSMSGYNPGTQDFLVKLATNLIEGWTGTGWTFNGLKPEQVALGILATPAAGSSGYVSPDVVKKALRCLKAGTDCAAFTPPRIYPGFRGFMTWDINYDRDNGYTLISSLFECIHSAACD